MREVGLDGSPRTHPPDLAAKLAALPGGEQMVRNMIARGLAGPDFATAVQQCTDALPAMRQMQAQVQGQRAAEAGLLDLARGLTPQDQALIRDAFAAQGWPGVTQLLKDSGVREDVIEVATSTIAANGGNLDGLARAVSGRLQADHPAAQVRQAEQEIIKAGIERYTPSENDTPSERAMKEGEIGKILRDPATAAQAGEWMRSHAAHLAERGLRLADGESPAEFIVRRAVPALLAKDGGSYDGHAGLWNSHRQPGVTPKIDTEEGLQRFTEAIGETERAGVVGRVVAQLDAAHTRDLLRARLAERDDRIRREHPITPSKEDQARIAKDANRRAVLATRAAEIEAAESAKRSGFASEAPEPVRESAPRPASNLGRSYEGQSRPSSGPRPPSREEISMESRRTALSEAWDQMKREDSGSAAPAEEVQP
jgi:hypothetical protein